MLARRTASRPMATAPSASRLTAPPIRAAKPRAEAPRAEAPAALAPVAVAPMARARIAVLAGAGWWLLENGIRGMVAAPSRSVGPDSRVACAPAPLGIGIRPTETSRRGSDGRVRPPASRRGSRRAWGYPGGVRLVARAECG